MESKDNENLKSQLLGIQSNLLNFAYMLTSDKDDAHDLLQETSLQILSNEDKYRSNINFKGWAFTIMRHLFINHYRKESRNWTTVDDSQDLYRINMAVDTTQETPLGALTLKDLHNAINELPEELRQPFSMFVSGYHYAEIASHTGVALGTVKSRIYFARKRLQSRLKNERYL